MAKNQYFEYMTPCKWGKRPWRQSPIRVVINKVLTLKFYRDGF